MTCPCGNQAPLGEEYCGRCQVGIDDAEEFKRNLSILRGQANLIGGATEIALDAIADMLEALEARA